MANPKSFAHYRPSSCTKFVVASCLWDEYAFPECEGSVSLMFLNPCGFSILTASIKNDTGLSIDDKVASKHRCDAACMTIPWLFVLGFDITALRIDDDDEQKAMVAIARTALA